MERNKIIVLAVGIFLALSSLAAIVYSPVPSTAVRPGTYSGETFGVIRSFVDTHWVLVSPQDTNGLYVVSRNGSYVVISVGDVNKTLQILKEDNVGLFYRDAIVEANVNLDGTVRDMNLYAYVLPYHRVGDVIPIYYEVTIDQMGNVYARAQEVLGPRTG